MKLELALCIIDIVLFLFLSGFVVRDLDGIPITCSLESLEMSQEHCFAKCNFCLSVINELVK